MTNSSHSEIHVTLFPIADLKKIFFSGNESFFNYSNFSEKQRQQAPDIWCHRKSMTTDIRRGEGINL